MVIIISLQTPQFPRQIKNVHQLMMQEIKALNFNKRKRGVKQN